MCNRSVVLALAATLAPPAPADDGTPLTIGDLDAYRSALRGPTAEPEAVGFRDLWEHPDRYQGRGVAIEGEAVRRFRQGPIGEFPPLVELWIASKVGDPTCLVYPEPEGGDPTPLGATVRFVGTYQKRLRYEAGDEPRLAPLLVGPGPPTVVRDAERDPVRPASVLGEIDGIVALILGLVIATTALRLVLLLARPRRRRSGLGPAGGPPPRFVDAEPSPYNPDGAPAHEERPDDAPDDD